MCYQLTIKTSTNAIVTQFRRTYDLMARFDTAVTIFDRLFEMNSIQFGLNELINTDHSKRQ